MIEQLAVVVYGVLTLIAAIFLASMQHSVLGMALAFAAAGTTYLYQLRVMTTPGPTDNVDFGFTLLVIILTVASAAASIFGF